MSSAFSTNVKILDAITSTATSLPVDVSQRYHVSIQFVCSAFTSGSGSFQVQISNDDVNYVNYGSPVVLSSATSSFFFNVNPQDVFRSIQVVGTVAGTGTYSATLQAI